MCCICRYKGTRYIVGTHGSVSQLARANGKSCYVVGSSPTGTAKGKAQSFSLSSFILLYKITAR